MMNEKEINLQEEEINLRDYLRILNRRKWTIATVFVIVSMIGVIVTFTNRPTPMYQAAVRVMIERSVSDSFTGQRIYSGYDPEFLQTQTEIIRGQGVAKKVVAAIGADMIYGAYFPEGVEEVAPSLIASVKMRLREAYGSFKKVLGIDPTVSTRQEGEASDAVSALLAGSPATPPTRAEIVENVVRYGISVTSVTGTRVILISYKSPNPALSMRVANTVAHAYIEQLLDMSMQMSDYSIEWMTKKAEEQRRKLEEAELALHEYKRKHNIVTIEDRLAILPQRLAEFSERLTQAEVRRKDLEAVYNQVKGRSIGELETMRVIAGHASVDSINRDIRLAEQQLSDLSEKFGPRHPRMIAAQSELSQLGQTRQRELQKAVQTVENEYLLAKAQEKNMREMLDQTKFEAARLNEQTIQLDIIKRTVDTNRYLYNLLIKRLEEEGLTEKNKLVNVWVIEDAKMPVGSIPQNRKKKLTMTFALALFGGLGLAFFLEFLDNTVKTPEDAEDRFNLPVMGAIERLKEKDQSVLDSVLQHESSIISENFKTLRTALLLSSASNAPRVILVTSMGAKEGKSTISSCLGVAMARNGLKVLLVDGDMRRPQLHTYFELESKPGLSGYLAGIATRDLFSKAVIPHLDVMTAGIVPPNPSELLSSERFDRLMKKSREKYDIIILDSPPLAVSDAMLLSRYADNVLLVAKAGVTRYEMVEKAIKKLREVSAPLNGIVLNAFDAKKSGYYHNYGDYYYSSDNN